MLGPKQDDKGNDHCTKETFILPNDPDAETGLAFVR